MPELIYSKKFISDLNTFKNSKDLRKKIAKTLKFLEQNPHHPGLKIERIVNDPFAWSAIIDKRYRISFEPLSYINETAPDWSFKIKILRIPDHDDLYKTPG
ncbi:MAG: hypothetical protein AB7E04_06085 [Desulfobacteraceae bacterium]